MLVGLDDLFELWLVLVMDFVLSFNFQYTDLDVVLFF